MNKYDRKAAALKVMTLDSEAASPERFDEKAARRALVRTRGDVILMVSNLSMINRQMKWVIIVLSLILVALIVIAMP